MEMFFISVGYKVKRLLTASLLLIISSQLMAGEVDLTGRTEKDLQQDAGRKPAQVIKFSGVKAGDHVLDLYGGGGYYSELLSPVVGEKGEVVLQIPEAYLKYVDQELKDRLANNRLKNVTRLLSESDDLKLGENRFDMVFLVLGYHDMFVKQEDWEYDVKMIMPQVHKSLKNGAKLLIIDHQAAKGRGIADTQTLHRIEESFVITDLEKRGFQLISKSDILANSADDHSEIVFKPELRRKTDRFALLFEKVEQ